ncbi:hypothetical protein D6827_00335 [Candidatus Parcubacteria bacterium]|nr:MAG: hypothetical protein D6827_00335 [Candidatus Parcubacteria bacterium]
MNDTSAGVIINRQMSRLLLTNRVFNFDASREASKKDKKDRAPAPAPARAHTRERARKTPAGVPAPPPPP